MSESKRKTFLWFLIGIVLISLGLRLYGLNDGLWIDEYTTYIHYARLPFGEIFTSFESENQHFLYSFMAHASFVLFGESNWALRLPAVLFGLGSIVALYLFGRQASIAIEALLASALMAFSYYHVWFSQNARGYTGMLFWTLISSWLLLISLRKQKIYLWVLFGLSAALGAYTHLTMLFVLAGQFLVVAGDFLLQSKYRNKHFFIQALVGFGCAGLFTLLLHLPVFNDMRSIIGGSQVSVVTEWKSPLWTIREILIGLEIGFSGYIAATIALLMLGLGLFSYSKTYPEVVGLFVIPPIIGAGITIMIGHHLWPRFFFFAYGFGALILIRGVMVFTRWLGRIFKITPQKINSISIAMCIVLILLSTLSIPYAYGPKQDFDGALAFFEEQLQPGDQIVTVGIAANVYDDFYHTGWKRATSKDELNALRATGNSTWLVYTFPEVLAAVSPDIMTSIQNDFLPVKQFPGSIRSGTIYIVKSNN